MSHPASIRVLLADDHEMVRAALARILDDSGSVEIVGQIRSGNEVLEAVNACDPQCVVLDYSMPGLDTPAVIELLQKRKVDVKILVLTVHENIHYAVRVLECGAHGYMIKSAAVDELVEAIKTVHGGGIYISHRISAQVLNHLRRPKRERVGLESLSQREFDLVRLIGSGKTLQQCARQMNVSTSTVSTYRSRVLEKLNLESTAELIRFALEQGLAD